MKNILLILGPNLNMVGLREKNVYGDETAEKIIKYKPDIIKTYSGFPQSFQVPIKKGGRSYPVRRFPNA